MALTKITGEGIGTLSSSGATTATFNRATSDGSIINLQKDGTSVGDIGARGGDTYMATSDTGIRAYDAQNAIIPVGTDGASRDAAVNLGIGSIRWQNLYLSGGVYLGGTGSANYLTDYETGSWTPTYTGGTSNPTVVYGFQVGFYTKIGKIVHIQGRLRTTSKSGGSGALRISGLPFTTISDSQSYSSINIPWAQGFATQTNPSSSYVYVNATSILLLRFNGSDARSGRTTEVTTANMGTGTNNNDVMFAGTYMTNE